MGLTYINNTPCITSNTLNMKYLTGLQFNIYSPTPSALMAWIQIT